MRKKWNGKRGFVFLLVLSLLLSVLMPAHAALLEAYHYEQAFAVDHGLSGLFASFTESFYAGNWAVEKAELTLNFAITQLAIAEISTYTISVNGQKVYSAHLPATDGEKQQERIVLQPETVKEGINYLTIETYIRTNDPKPCVDDVSLANWMNVYQDSFVSIAYRPLAVIGSIAALYKQFTSIDALSLKQSAFVLGAGAADSVLGAAALSMAGMAKNAPLFYENIGLRIDDGGDALFSDPYQIYLSRYDQLAGDVLAALTPEQRMAAQTGIALALITRSDDYVLAAIGADDKAMDTIGRLLGNAAYISQMQNAWTALSSSSNVLLPVSQVQPYVMLTDAGSYVKGAFRQNASFYIQFPENRALADESQIRLVFRYAENLDFDRSLVTVYINDTPIGSKKLSQENARGDNVELSIPTDIKVSGSFSVRVAFDLEIKDLWCTLRQEDTPWAYVSNESMMRLNSVDVQGLLFDNYPSPFVMDGQWNNVAVVLPDFPSWADYEMLRLMILTMGRYLTNNTGVLSVQRGISKGTLPAANTIVIGRYGVNQIAQDLNGEMFFRFSQDGSTIESNEKMLIEPGFGAGLASVQLNHMPLSGHQRALMVVSGVSDEAMLKAIPYLGSVEGLWQVYGDGFVASSEAAHSFRFKEDNAAVAPAAWKMLERQDVLGLSLAAGGVLLLTLFAFSMMMVKHRRRK